MNTSSRIEHLEQRRRALKQEISALDRQRFLTDDEQSRRHALKKASLAAKDELTGLRRGPGPD